MVLIGQKFPSLFEYSARFNLIIINLDDVGGEKR